METGIHAKSVYNRTKTSEIEFFRVKKKLAELGRFSTMTDIKKCFYTTILSQTISGDGKYLFCGSNFGEILIYR